MVLVITQETFNEAVEENINELGLSAEEAVEEAVMQFTLQGVDLSQIVKGVMTNPEDNDAVKDILNKLTELNKSKSPVDEITKQLTLLRTECDRGLNYRVLAGKAGAYDILLEALSSNTTDQLVVENCLKAMISLMSKQPDLLDSRGIDTMYSYFAKNIMDEHKRLALKWARECCILHETNRRRPGCEFSVVKPSDVSFSSVGSDIQILSGSFSELRPLNGPRRKLMTSTPRAGPSSQPDDVVEVSQEPREHGPRPKFMANTTRVDPHSQQEDVVKVHTPTGVEIQPEEAREDIETETEERNMGDTDMEEINTDVEIGNVSVNGELSFDDGDLILEESTSSYQQQRSEFAKTTK